MRNIILAAAAALVLALGAAPSFASAQHQNNGATADASRGTNFSSNCANILANPTAYPPRDVAECRAR
jgi:hypothetical protein